MKNDLPVIQILIFEQTIRITSFLSVLQLFYQENYAFCINLSNLVILVIVLFIIGSYVRTNTIQFIKIISYLNLLKKIILFNNNNYPSFAMCGRLFQTLPLARLIKIAQASCVKNPEHYSTSYNVCPTTYIPAIKASSLYASQHQQDGQDNDLQDQNNREMQFMTWGHKTNFNFIVNGRIEQMLQKRTFLKYINNRCVVIMEGYYQWNTKKQPFSFRPKGTDHFLIAALYTDEKEIIILTKEATKQLSVIHHRMPVILSHEQVNIWLNPKNTKIINSVINKSLLNKQKQIWRNIGFAKLAPYVSSIKEKSQKCLMTFQDYKKQLDKTGLMRFWKKAPQVQGVDKQGKVTKVPEKQQIQQKMLQEQEVINQSTQKRAISQNRLNSNINNKSKIIQQSQQAQKIENQDQNHKSQKQKRSASLQMLEQGQQ